MALSARHIGYSYLAGTAFSVEAVRDVDLAVEPGELVIVAGTTGSGKSTLLRLLAGLLAPTSGVVEVDGTPASAREARGRVAIVFQNPESQFFAETVSADVAFGPRNLGMSDPEAEADRALGAVGLDPVRFGERSPFALSGGEARRAAIAGALAMRARYLLLDEPTAGLDVRGRSAVVDAVTAERAHAGVVVVTHDPEDFLVHADRVLALSRGACAFSGSVFDLLEQPERYEAAGLSLPELVQVQRAARERGIAIPRIELDPRAAAAGVLAGRGGAR